MKFLPVSQSSLTAMIQKLVFRDNWEGKKKNFPEKSVNH